MMLFVEELGKGMRAVLEGFNDELSKRFLLPSAQLDAEEFWDEWPDIIGE